MAGSVRRVRVVPKALLSHPAEASTAGSQPHPFLRSQAVLRDPPQGWANRPFSLRDPCLPAGGGHPGCAQAPRPAEVGGRQGSSDLPEEPASLFPPGPQGVTCDWTGRQRAGRWSQWGTGVGRVPGWVSQGGGLLATAGGVGGVEAGHLTAPGPDPAALPPGGSGEDGPSSCYCKWAGGFLFPWRARLASASPDKGASSWPAVSPPDHRVVGGARGARLWLRGNRLERGGDRQPGSAEHRGPGWGAGCW